MLQTNADDKRCDDSSKLTENVKVLIIISGETVVGFRY